MRQDSKMYHRYTRKCVCTVHTNNFLSSLPIRLQMCTCVPLPLTRIFHFITSLVCDDRDKTVVTEMSGGGRKKGVWNWTGNYVLQLRHGGDIKSYTPVPGDKMQEGGDAMEGDSSIRIPGFLIEPGGGGKQGRETGRLCLIMYLELV